MIIEEINKMWKWVEKLFKREEPEPEVEIYACPHCGSTNLGYYTGLVNFIQVINDIEKPKYGESARCLNCGYRTEVYLEDSDKDISYELVRVK
jgi:predicted nucleic-acid-binding Zn-ribbon protein